MPIRSFAVNSKLILKFTQKGKGIERLIIIKKKKITHKVRGHKVPGSRTYSCSLILRLNEKYSDQNSVVLAKR